jgi:hypothetical protein
MEQAVSNIRFGYKDETDSEYLNTYQHFVLRLE